MRLIPLTRHRSAGYGIDQGLTKRWQPMFPERQDGHLNHACGGAPANNGPTNASEKANKGSREEHVEQAGEQEMPEVD